MAGKGFGAYRTDSRHADPFGADVLHGHLALGLLNKGVGKLRASRTVGTFMTIGSDKNTIEALFKSPHDPSGLDSGRTGQADHIHRRRIVYLSQTGLVDAGIGDFICGKYQDPGRFLLFHIARFRANQFPEVLL